MQILYRRRDLPLTTLTEVATRRLRHAYRSDEIVRVHDNTDVSQGSKIIVPLSTEGFKKAHFTLGCHDLCTRAFFHDNCPTDGPLLILSTC
jgi:hypothetical protein